MLEHVDTGERQIEAYRGVARIRSSMTSSPAHGGSAAAACWTLLGGHGNPHLHPIHLLSNLLIAGGFILLASAWHVLYEAQRAQTLAVSRPA